MGERVQSNAAYIEERKRLSAKLLSDAHHSVPSHISRHRGSSYIVLPRHDCENSVFGMDRDSIIRVNAIASHSGTRCIEHGRHSAHGVKNASIWTHENGSVVIVWSALAVELLPTLPAPLSIITCVLIAIVLTCSGCRDAVPASIAG